jgi:glycerol-3-phosphate dehydrogenase
VIRRDLGAARDPHDLIVVGGGVYGIMVALEAARRGLRPLLVERGDYGGATSWNSLRIVHGGLRYLQTLDLVRLRESVAERRWFLATFPDLVQPLDCLMPLYGDGLKRPALFRAALAANDLLFRRRNEGVDPARRIDRGTVLGAADAARRVPEALRPGLQGAALWQDAVMPRSQRLLIEALRWAVAAGAAALNYVEAEGLLAVHGQVAGVAARDRLSGASLELRAPVVVNCGGPWSAALAARLDRPVARLFRPSLALNLFLDRAPLVREALAVAPRGPGGGRMYFMYPWHGGVFAGTFHAPWHGDPEADGPGDAAVEGLLHELNAAVPGWDLTAADMLRVHWGLLPARAADSDRLAVRPVLHDHGAAGGPDGLYSVSGVKFTTARRVAERTVDHVLARGRVRARVPHATPRPQPAEVPDAPTIAALAERDPAAALDLARRIVRDEAVRHPDDLLLRRTDWGEHPARGRALAALAARALETPAPAGAEVAS